MGLIHGKEGSKVYDVWVNMKQRCYNANHHTYKHYGKRGIIVCSKWLTFKGFYEDMGDPPTDYTLERKNPNGNYELNNCCWIHRSKQTRNIRKSIFVEFNGQKKHLAEWCEDLNLKYKTVFQRIKRDNKTPIEALGLKAPLS